MRPRKRAVPLARCGRSCLGGRSGERACAANAGRRASERCVGRAGYRAGTLLVLRLERKVKLVSASRSRSRSRLRLAALAAVLLVVLVSPAAADAATRTVSQSGTDSGNCTLSPCRTINYGTSQASPGDTVSVGSGTFVESRVVINRPLTLQGAGVGQTIVKQDPANPNGTAPGLIGIDSPSTGNITIQGFTLEGANRQNTGDEPFLIYGVAMPAGGTLDVNNNAFVENSTLDPQLGADYSVGLYINGSGAALHATGNTFKGMFQGLFFEGDRGPATIQRNDFDGLPAFDGGNPACGGVGLPDGVFLLT